MKKGLRYILILLLPIIFSIAGCGGGDGDGDNGNTNTVSGVAAAGAPLVGTAYLKDSSTPGKELSSTIAADGSFFFNVDGLKPPFIFKGQGTVASTTYTLYSFSSGPDIANINPFTNLAVAIAAGSADLGTLYANPTTATMQLIAANLSGAVTDIQTKLQSLLTLYDATDNPISDSYLANHLGLDGMLDLVKVDLSTTGTVTLTNKATNAVIYTGSINNFTNGTLITGNIPQPPSSVSIAISPTLPTVATNGTQNFTATVIGTSNAQVTWSVVEANGGSITSSGVYAAPATAGTYHVKAVSVADSSKSATATVNVRTTATPLSLNGTFSGTGSDSSGPGPMTWQLDQNNATVSGPVVMLAPLYNGGAIVLSGSIAGVLSDTTLTFTITIPVGGISGFPSCSTTVSGTATGVTNSAISGTYTGSNTCTGPVTNGLFTLTKQ